MSSPQMPGLIEAALIIPVPEAEALVGVYRQKYDPSAASGVPAHITLNYPFKPHVFRPAEARAALSKLLPVFSRFPFVLSEVRSFAGVIYLAPDPAAPFVAMVRAIADAFPDSPPYEGQFEEVVPHLTVAQADEAAIPAIEAEFREQARLWLPIPAQATTVWLMDSAQLRWETRAVFPLGGSAAGDPG